MSEALAPDISTARLRLREASMEDADRITELAGDYDVARMTTSIPHPMKRDQAVDFLERMAVRERAVEQLFAIERPGEGLIGMIGFHPSADTPAPEVGYWIGKPYWGQGYASEAAAAAIGWAGAGWGKRFVVSGHFADNPASGRVLEKTGFLYTGVVAPRHSAARGEDAATRMMVWLP
jgi:RimJ/RimL family protein N-acetyltransferase